MNVKIRFTTRPQPSSGDQEARFMRHEYSAWTWTIDADLFAALTDLNVMGPHTAFLESVPR